MSLTSPKQNKTEKTNKQTERTLAGTPQQPCVANYSEKKKFLKNTAIQEKLQVIGRDKGRALLHFKQIELNERGSLQS